jgi:polysaccharide pyruvyl transferase WcaK-like protein
VGRLDLKAKLRAIRWADVVVIGGGGQFNDNSSRTGGAHLVLTFLLAELFKRPVFVTATGFGPLRRRLARGVWRSLGRSPKAQFAFREAIAERAYRDLTGRDAILVWDLALSGLGRDMILDLVGVPRPHGAALLNFRTFRRNREVEKVIVETMLAEGYRIEGVMADSKDDVGPEGFAQHGIDQCRNYGGIADFLSAIAGSEAVVTQRFHVLVACALLGVPVVPLVYAEKMLDFCECFGLHYVTVRDNDPVKIKNEVHAALAADPIDLALLTDRSDPLKWLEAALWQT